jgi:hypothetical protein
MSVHKDARSPYWQYNFQINGQRYYGSTKCKEEHEAETIERAAKIRVRQGNFEEVNRIALRRLLLPIYRCISSRWSATHSIRR